MNCEVVGGVTALFVRAAPGEPDEHAVIQTIKNTIIANRARATVFHQSCGSLLNTLSIVLLLYFNSAARRILPPIKYPARSTSACFRISLSGMAVPTDTSGRSFL